MQTRALPSHLFLCPALLVAAVFFLFGRSIDYDFAADDSFRILKDAFVTGNGGVWWQVFFTPTFPGDLFRPLTALSWRLNYYLSGTWAGAFHLTNLALHAWCAVEMLWLVRKMLSPHIALLAALVFAVHPLTVESVINISGRADILAACFTLLSLRLYVVALDSHGQARRSFLWTSAAAALAAALSKESGVVVVLLAGLTGMYLQKTGRPQVLKGLVPLLIGVGCAVVLRVMVLDEQSLGSRSTYFLAENPLLGPDVSFFERVFPALQLIGRYLLLMMLPIQLSADYSQSHADFWAEVWSSVGFARFLTFMCWCGLGLFWRRHIWSLFIWWVPLAFSVACNLFLPIGTIFGERLAYLPLVGAAVIFAAGSFMIAARYKLLWIALCVCVVVGLSVRSYLRTPLWRNNRTLLPQLALDAPRSPKAMEAAGKYWLYVHSDKKRARFFFERAIELDLHRVEALRYLVDLSKRENRIDDAVAYAERILKLTPHAEDIKRELVDLRLAQKTARR